MTTDTNEIIDRLDGYARRLYGSVCQATSLYAAFRSLNESEEWRKALIGPVAHAANIIQHALLRELTLVLVRVLDKPRVLETSDKISFVVIGLWLQKDEIRESLVDRARKRHGEKWADQHEQSTRAAIPRVIERLDRLATEEPNRERRLRNARDEFLAHELHLEIPRDQPVFGHLQEMTEEIQALCMDTSIAIIGFDLSFEHIAEGAGEGADELWKAVLSGRQG